MESIDYMHVIMYQKCEDCGYVGEDLSFILKQETITHNSTGISITNHIHCPMCNSEHLGPMHLDRELTEIYKPPMVGPNDEGG